MQSVPRQPPDGNVATSFVSPTSPGAGHKRRGTRDARPGSDPARKHPSSLCSLAACLAAALGLNVAHPGIAMTALSVSVTRAPAQLRGAAKTQRQMPSGGSARVTNCNDSGSGSLRDIAGQAGEGSSIYLTALTCSTITLTSGAVNFLIDSVTLNGPGPDKLTIVGNGSDRVIGHGGNGTLSINGLTLTNGAITNSGGGCVYSSGTMRLYDTVVSSCSTYSTGPYTVLGGGVYARQDLSISNSTITGNLVTGPYGHAYGGGAFVRGALDVFGSTVSNNVASNSGGIASLGDVSIAYSTISGNQANDNAGLALFAHYVTQPFEINATTISGNVASNLIGGIGVLAETHIYNSTIADNRDGGRDLGAGLFGGTDVPMYLQSTIVAGNFSGTDRSDAGGYSGATLSGANNLVMTSNLTLPPNTLTSDPLLGPLADNGGPTFTHALLPGSPAIDAGNNIAAEFYDQRSNGLTRLIGASADIGAYEVQSTGTRSTVANCNDSGTGSLRDVVASAQSGDSIDLSGLACSTITLTSGAIVVDQGTLTLAGPGSQALSIDGNDSDRVIHHRGVGTLHLTGLSLTQGYYLADGEAHGGCVNSASSLALIDISVSDCRIISTAPGALSAGGGLSAQHVNMQSSIVANNEAGATAALASSGGAYVRGNLSMYESTIDNNSAAGSAQNGSYEGGLFVGGNATIVGSTIAGNRADGAGGAALVGASRIFNSTISGNQAFRAVTGGLVAYQLSMYNSTVAFNTSSQAISSGLLVAGLTNLQSSIFFGNTAGTIEYDVGAAGYGAITGSHNLVGASPILLPADTIFSDPLLGPLQDNGGPTLTHALSPASPAIDVGNNVANLETDQRGEGFVRVFGTAADIGAFEVQVSDVIFRDGFD